MSEPRCQCCEHYEARLIRSNITGVVSVLHYCKLKMVWLGIGELRRGCHLHKPIKP